MRDDFTRFRVVVNPESGSASPVCFFPMGRRVLTAIEAVLCDNVRRLVKEQYQGKPGRVVKLHKHVRLQTLQNLYKAEAGCNVAALGPLADAFGVQPYQLLVRDLNVEHPQQVISAREMRAIHDLRGEVENDREGKSRA